MAMKTTTRSSVSELDRAALSVDDLTDTVVHLTLRMKVTETICQAIEVGRAADALKIAVSEAESVEQRIIERADAEENRKHIVPRSENLEFQGCGSESTITECDKSDKNGERSKNRPNEDVVAASIAELYDRVGGFIKR